MAKCQMFSNLILVFHRRVCSYFSLLLWIVPPFFFLLTAWGLHDSKFYSYLFSLCLTKNNFPGVYFFKEEEEKRSSPGDPRNEHPGCYWRDLP